MPVNPPTVSTRTAPSSAKKSAKRQPPGKRSKTVKRSIDVIELTDSDSDHRDYYSLLYDGTSGEEDPCLSPPNEQDYALVYGQKHPFNTLTNAPVDVVECEDAKAIAIPDTVHNERPGRKGSPQAVRLNAIANTVSTGHPSHTHIGEKRCATPAHLWCRGFYTKMPASLEALKIVNEMRTTAHVQPEHARFAFLNEDTNWPLDFGHAVETKLANHTIVLVSCSTPRPIPLDTDYIHQHLAISPNDSVSVADKSGSPLPSMRFEDFISRYEEEHLFIYAHPIRRNAMPMFLEHLDSGYGLGWGPIRGPVNLPYTVERLHASLQCYPSTFLKPHFQSEVVPGASVAIHVRAGMLILRVFCPSYPEAINDRLDYFVARGQAEKDKLACVVVEILPGELIVIPPGIPFDLYAPIPTMTTTTYFLNYQCLHLTEMTKCRAKFIKGNQQEINQIGYTTLVRMLYVLSRLPVNRTFSLSFRASKLTRLDVDLPVKALVALCGLVAYPSYYHCALSLPEVDRIQEANSWVFERLALGYREIVPCDFPGHFEYLLEPYEIEALATAYRVLRYARDRGMDIPAISFDADEFIIEMADGLEDFQLVGESKVWTRPGLGMDDSQWRRLVFGA